MNKEKLKQYLADCLDKYRMKNPSISEWDRSYGVSQVLIDVYGAIKRGEFDDDEDECVKAFNLIKSRRIDIRFVGDIVGLSPEIATTEKEIEFVQNVLGKIYEKK